MSIPSFNSSESLAKVDALDRPVEVLEAGTVVGRYVILHLLGQGAAGVVYAAYDAELDRKLALKFLRLRGDAEAVREATHRLRREAKVMAKLSHPNLVSIHDVGRVAEHMFLVMDFVDGGTLKHWLEPARPWRDVLELLCKAGDGLAAAHAAGVVHRDFKPANVLVSGDEPRVTDFGVAAAELGAPLSIPPALATAPPSARPLPAAGDDALQTSGVLGTIGYLAPEQAFLSNVDARSDQFGFCATLYQALYGVLPFPTDDLITYVEAIGRRAFRPVPSGTGVPRSLHAAMVRGLSENPEERFPSMDALLAELRRDRPREARRKLMWGALALALVGVGIVARVRWNERAPICPQVDEELGGTWTPAVRDRIGAGFKVAAPFGATSFAALSLAIDGRASGIGRMRGEACEAARVRGAQSESVMSLRLQCLDQRARELSAFVHLLGSADGKMVSGAAESLNKLPLVASCADVAALTAPVPPPTREIASSVQAIRADLAEVRAVDSLGHYADADERATTLVSRASALAYAPVLAEAKFALGRAQEGEGHTELADKTYRSVIDLADEGRDDRLRGDAYIRLSMVVGRRLGHYDAAIAATTTALHIAHRLSSEALEADALEQLGMDHGQTGLVEQGLNESTAALAIKERLKGPEALDCAGSHVAVSVALSELGRFDDAQREDKRALDIVRSALGPAHPTVGLYLGNLCVDLVWAGRAEEAIPVTEEGIRILRAALGTEHPDYATLVNDKGYALTKLGRYAEGLPFNEEAAAVSERVEGPESSSMTYPLVGVGEDLLGVNQPDRALPILERATRIADANGLDPETMGECHYHLARAVWLVRHDAVRSAALARKAVTDYQRSPRLAARAKAAAAFADERESKPR